jgi:uncharacterized protein YjbI with pentapeptide repeats
LSGANLSQANLFGASLQSALLHEADLSEADLRRTNLSGADLRHVEAWRANFKGSRIDPGELHALIGCEMP